MATKKQIEAMNRHVTGLTCAEGKKRSRFAIDSDFGPGLCLEVTATGSKFWKFRRGSEKEINLGRFPAMDYGLALEAHKLGQLNQLPENKPKVKHELTTWADVFNGPYKDRQKFRDLRDNSKEDIEGTWRRHMQQFGSLTIAGTTHETITKTLTGILNGEFSKRALVKEPCRRAWNIIQELVRQADLKGLADMGMLMRIDIREILTSKTIKKTMNLINAPGTEWHQKPRANRVLSVNELARLWAGMEADGGIYALVIQALILTGCRRNEMATLRADMIGPSTLGFHSIYMPVTKNDEPFTLGISKELNRIIEKAIAWHSIPPVYVFGAEVHGRFPMQGLLLHAWLLRWRKAHMPDAAAFSCHDLRRTFSTRAEEDLGMRRKMIEHCLNHVTAGDVEKRYNKTSYERAGLEVWDAWGNWVAGGCRSGKVAPLMRKEAQ